MSGPPRPPAHKPTAEEVLASFPDPDKTYRGWDTAGGVHADLEDKRAKAAGGKPRSYLYGGRVDPEHRVSKSTVERLLAAFVDDETLVQRKTGDPLVDHPQSRPVHAHGIQQGATVYARADWFRAHQEAEIARLRENAVKRAEAEATESLIAAHLAEWAALVEEKTVPVIVEGFE